jgi:anaerobic C4-dicarboxylate transporter DcuA
MRKHPGYITFIAPVVTYVLVQTLTNGVADSDQVSMSMVIMIIMIATAGFCIIAFKASPEATLKGSIMRGGIVAVISIVGVCWLGSSFFEGNRP